MAKILVVDDDLTMLTLYQDVLLSEGFEIITASNGDDGVNLAIKNVPDLILLDVMMPGKKGNKVSDELLANNKTKNIPVIFLTSIITEDEVKSQHGKISGRHIISKSSPPIEVIRRVKEVLASVGK